MAMTLLIVDDDVTKALGPTILDSMNKEIGSIYSFSAKFKVVMKKPADFPASIDFTEAIVKIVETDDEIGAVQNQAQQQQLKSIQVSLQQKNINIKTAAFMRTAAKPERGGVGWQAKSLVAAGGKQVAITQTGGVASLEVVKEEVLKGLAPNNWTLDEAAEARTSAIARARVDRDEAAKIKAANEAYEKSRSHWALQKVPFKDWSKPYQEAAGIALARLVAHEARHQYVIEHADEGGLGGESADLYGNAKTATFIKTDQKDILGALTKLEQDQKKADVLIETFPKGQPFAFG
jgi:hypothetical protein